MAEHVLLASGAGFCEVEWLEPQHCLPLFAADPYAIWLDSADTAHADGCYSFIVSSPYEIHEWRHGDTALSSGDAFRTLQTTLADGQAIWQDLPADWDAILPPFRGGMAGIFCYELAHYLEALPPMSPPYAVDDTGFPCIAVGCYNTVLAFDHTARRVFILATGAPEQTVAARRALTQTSLQAWQERLAQARVATAASDISPPSTAVITAADFTATEYKRATAAIIEHILDGDIFQANLSQRFHARLAAEDDALAYYLRLRQESAAPFAAYCRFGEWEICSSSPERFLKIHNGRVETNPIKGTSRRGNTPQADAANAHALINSEKDRAENIMIVDLLRNDLARVCEDASIQTPVLCRLESFPQVHHLVSTVVGRLKRDCTPVDALLACFPGGSITGAPKIRAMELIAQYEPTTRGPYCGCIGYIGVDGIMDINIAIRTAYFRGRQMRFHAGGGITIASDPNKEYDETLDKTVGLLSALRLSRADLEQATDGTHH